jgi:hypothetical protein
MEQSCLGIYVALFDGEQSTCLASTKSLCAELKVSSYAPRLPAIVEARRGL